MKRVLELKRAITRPTTWLLLACVPLLGACLAEVWEPDVGELRTGLCKPEDSDPDQEVSFHDDVLPLFKRPFGQGGCSCHIPMGRRASGLEATGLELSSYRTLMQGGNQTADTIVLPGDPCGSVVVQKVSNAPPYGSRMPSDGPPYLTPSEQALLADWIAEGARDNLMNHRWVVSAALLLLMACADHGTRRGDRVDVSGYPPDIQAAYRVFAQRCSRCHTLARPLNAHIHDPQHWVRYVARMRRQPGSGINRDNADVILKFLLFYHREPEGSTP